MAKYLVETFYTCTFKVSHYLDKIDEKELENLEKKEGKTSIKFEIKDKQNQLVFDLKEKRKIDFKQLNSLKIKENLILD